MSQTFKQYLLLRGLSTSTSQWYNMYLLDFISWLDKENISTEQVSTPDIMSYLQYLKNKGQANVTRSSHLIAIKHYYDWQQKINAIDHHPAKQIKIRGTQGKTLYPILTQAELDQIYHNYPVNENEQLKNRNWYEHSQLSRQRNKVILGLMVWQGLTTAEVNNLTISDLKLNDATLCIAGTRKGQERALKLKSQQIMGLMEYQFRIRPQLMKFHDSETINLFLTTPAIGKGQAADTHHIWKRLSQDVHALQPNFINFQQVRASVITHWLKKYNLREVQYMAGHKYASTTEGYIVNQVEDLQQDIDKFHPIG